MKECEAVKKILSRYLDKETGSRDTVFVKNHLNACQECGRKYLELLMIKQFVMGKERKKLPADYMVCRLREEIACRKLRFEGFSWIEALGGLSRKLIPVPVVAMAIVVFIFSFFSSGREDGEYSLEDHILSGQEATADTAAQLLLGA